MAINRRSFLKALGLAPVVAAVSQVQMPGPQAFMAEAVDVEPSILDGPAREFIAMVNQQIYVGGQFTSVEGAAVNGIARWGGTAFQGIEQLITTGIK